VFSKLSFYVLRRTLKSFLILFYNNFDLSKGLFVSIVYFTKFNGKRSWFLDVVQTVADMSGSSAEDDVLSLSLSDDSFSGFEAGDIVQTPRVESYVDVTSEDVVPDKNKSKSKSKTSKSGNTQKGKKPHSKTNGPKKTKSSKQKSKGDFDLNKLSQDDLRALREKLRDLDSPSMHTSAATGIMPNSDYGNDIEQENIDRSLHYPDLHVTVDRDDITETEVHYLDRDIFSDDEWVQPKQKALQKDKPVGQSLANLINTACITRCDTDDISYKMPENVTAGPPLVNNEVWSIMDKRAQSQDRGLSQVQGLVATAMVPVMKLAEELKPQLKTESKKLISDTLVLLGQVQYNLSLRRRYAIRPTLKKKYQNLCKVTVPITDKLFGDDISKEVKACDALHLGKDQYFASQRAFGRGRPGQYNQYSQRGRGYDRYQPYPQGRGRGWQPRDRPFPRPPTAPGRRASATPAPPNDH